MRTAYAFFFQPILATHNDPTIEKHGEILLRLRDEEGNLILAKDWNVANPETKRKYAWQHELITMNGIVGFSRCLLHWGNTDLDTEGCYIVGSVFGKTKGRDGVLNSRKKYTEIYPLIFRAIKKGKSTIKFIDNE